MDEAVKGKVEESSADRHGVRLPDPPESRFINRELSWLAFTNGCWKKPKTATTRCSNG